MLGHWNHGLRLSRLSSCVITLRNEDVCDQLKQLIIRHTKAQRIRGEVALALPDADCQTHWLDMSPHERALYGVHACADGVPSWADVNRCAAHCTAAHASNAPDDDDG